MYWFKLSSLSCIWDASELKELLFCWCAGHVNVAPRHLTAEAETLLSATLIHEVGLVFVHKWDEIGSLNGYLWHCSP